MNEMLIIEPYCHHGDTTQHRKFLSISVMIVYPTHHLYSLGVGAGSTTASLGLLILAHFLLISLTAFSLFHSTNFPKSLHFPFGLKSALGLVVPSRQ